MTKDEIEIAARRLGESKLRLLHKEPFFASLLMGTPIVLDEPEKTGATDGKKIYVNPRLAIASTPQFLDFLLTHEVMHIALNHCIRYPNMNLAWNVAADCVANSIILESYPKDYSEFDVEKWHCIPPTCPDGSKGCVHTVQEIYDMLPNRLKREGDFSKLSFDSHGRFARGTDEQSNPDDGETISIDSMALADAMESLGGEDCGEMPRGLALYINHLKNGQLDWREVLDAFVQQDANDYSFCPPDKRFDGFLLPDFNEPDLSSPGKILFAVDTSGSMSDEAIQAVYGEILGAIEQYSGRLEGYVGFFNHAFYGFAPFSTESELLEIPIKGRGGTNVRPVFDYLGKHEELQDAQSLIIMTDGYLDFPKEEAALGIPVLWVIVNEEVTPPWGKVARVNPSGT